MTVASLPPIQSTRGTLFVCLLSCSFALFSGIRWVMGFRSSLLALVWRVRQFGCWAKCNLCSNPSTRNGFSFFMVLFFPSGWSIRTRSGFAVATSSVFSAWFWKACVGVKVSSVEVVCHCSRQQYLRSSHEANFQMRSSFCAWLFTGGCPVTCLSLIIGSAIHWTILTIIRTSLYVFFWPQLPHGWLVTNPIKFAVPDCVSKEI